MGSIVDAMNARLMRCDQEISFRYSRGAKMSMTEGFWYKIMP
jgi:hypothetical protein